MNLLDRFQGVDAMEQRHQPDLFQVEVSTEEVSGSYATASCQSKYRLKAEIWVEFYANNAQYERVLKDARRVALHKIYGDMLIPLAEIRMLADRGDYKALIQKTFELEAEWTK